MPSTQMTVSCKEAEATLAEMAAEEPNARRERYSRRR